MIEIIITDEIKSKARDRADKISRIELYNHGGLREPDAPYNGFLGEEAVYELFDRESKWFHHTSSNVERPDNGDFAINIFNVGKFKLDVKTASQPHYNYHLVPVSQPKYPYYIGVRLNGDIAEIQGWCKYYEMYDIPTDKPPFAKIDNKGMKFTELQDIDDLLDSMM